jgi:ABC-type antimicrobial peptide transport system permease subunit
MLAIAILLGISMILNIAETKGNFNALMAAALCVSLYGLSLPVFVVTLILLIIIGLNASLGKD